MTSESSAAIKTLLSSRLHDRKKQVCDWVTAELKQAPPPFYCSIDLRDAGFKIVPVDCNLYPAGFNNICPEDLRTSPQILKKQLAHYSAKKVLLIPESHTTNKYYIENLYYLSQILVQCGFEISLGWLSHQEEAPLLISESGKELKTAHIIREGNRLKTQSDGKFFDPDLILLNNDFSSGYPSLLDGLEQPILPSHKLGWHTRTKNTHFDHYNRLAATFANLIDVDPWLLQVDTELVRNVDFNEGIGIEETANVVARILERTQKAYDSHHISRKPFAFIKNNMGTYGMGITVVHSPEEVLAMNRRTKNKMSVGKNKLKISSIIVQEGVPTATLVDRLASEPVIYLFSHELIGGFLRTNTERSDEDNLNSQGMVFRKLCMSDLRDLDEDELGQQPVLELVYGTIARLSALAAGRELKLS